MNWKHSAQAGQHLGFGIWESLVCCLTSSHELAQGHGSDSPHLKCKDYISLWSCSFCRKHNKCFGFIKRESKNERHMFPTFPVVTWATEKRKWVSTTVWFKLSLSPWHSFGATWPSPHCLDGSRCRKRSNGVSGVFLRSGLIQDVGIPGPGTSGPPWSLRTSVLSKAHLVSTFHFLVMPHVMGPMEENAVLTLVEASSGLQSQSTHWLTVSVAPDSPLHTPASSLLIYWMLMHSHQLDMWLAPSFHNVSSLFQVPEILWKKKATFSWTLSPSH